MSRPKRYSLAIELTAFCNQKCGYCYNDWRDEPSTIGSLPREELLGLVDRALTEVEFDHVTLTGGEPFARPEIFDVLAVIQKHGKRALIISNGGIVTEAHAERLAPYNPLFVQVTLNGPNKELHEEHVGKDCFEPTLAGIRALTKFGVPVTGCIVITRKNARVVGEILSLWKSLGATDVALSRYSPAGYASEQVAELLPTRSELLEALRQASPFGEAGMRLQVTMPVPQCVVDHAEFPHVNFGGCPIGTEMQEFALGPRGELRNCTLHTDVVGDAKKASFAELVTAPSVMHYRDVTPEFCAPCPYKSSCLGGCGAAAHSVFGERGLDPFVAQHVDDVFGDKLRAARKGIAGFVPATRLARRSAEGAAR
ncbi:MAG: radical SAM protein [Polyangiaceae bacterium]|nr:radical SAM protein [Polyangiaceae bacterium]